MWGNALGWTISGILLAAMLYTVHLIDRAGRVSSPTGFSADPAHLAIVALPVPPRTVLPTGD